MFQTNDLEFYFEKISQNGWALLPLSESFLETLSHEFQFRQIHSEFKNAKLTHSNDLFLNIRNDQTFWLSPNTDLSLSVGELKILENLNNLQNDLKNFFRIPINVIECHYAKYPKGHFYKKHFDTTINNNRRQFSFVIYLNKNWKPADEGLLVGYESDRILFKVEPKWGHMILFRSNIEHEVEPTLAERLSLTGWFRR